MPGKVTIILVSNQHTTAELDKLLHQDAGNLGYFTQRGLDKAQVYIVPSDDTEEQIKEEYFK